MSKLVESHSYLFHDRSFTDDQSAALSKIASTVLAAETADGAEAVLLAILKQAADKPFAMLKVANVVAEFAETEADAEKRAAFKDVAHGVAAGMMALPALTHVVRIGTQALSQSKAFKEVLRRHPELKDDPDINKYYTLIKRFAPQVAADEIMLEHVLLNMHAEGRGRITPYEVQQLVGFEEQARKTRGELPRSLAEFGKAVPDIVHPKGLSKDKKKREDGGDDKDDRDKE